MALAVFVGNREYMALAVFVGNREYMALAVFVGKAIRRISNICATGVDKVPAECEGTDFRGSVGPKRKQH
jgi:hypothetical protein